MPGRHGRVLDEPLGAEEAELLAAEVDDDDGAPSRIGGESARQLEDRRGAGGVVVGAVADRVARPGIERPAGRATEVVEVGSDDDHLATRECAVAARRHRHDVLSRQSLGLARVGELGAAGHELLDERHAPRSTDVVAASPHRVGHDRQEPERLVPAGEPGRRAVVARRPRAATLEPIVSQISNVALESICHRVSGTGTTLHGAAGGQEGGRTQYGAQGDEAAGGGQGRLRGAHRSARSGSES